MEISIEEIEKKFESLPEEIRWAIMAANIDDKVIEIGQSHQLDVSQMGQLSLEVHMVVFGLVQPDKFEESLKNSLKLPDDKTKDIVSDVNKKILKDIREKFMSLYESPGEDKEEPAKPEIKKTPTLEKESEESMSSKDNAILKGAGIEIMPTELEDGKDKTLPADKLSESFKTPKTVTSYTTSPVAKTEAPKSIPVPKVDPYRMPIE